MNGNHSQTDQKEKYIPISKTVQKAKFKYIFDHWVTTGALNAVWNYY